MSVFENEKKENEAAAGASFIERESRISGIRCECSQDYVLPDYMGDVKRLLRYTASAVPCNKYVSGGEVSFLCTVNFRVMYLDSDNILTEASFSTDFEHSEKVSDTVTDATVTSDVHNVTVRLGGPRKISAKASLVTDISLSEECPRDEGDFSDAICMRKTVKVHSADYGKSAEREYAEELERFEDLLADEVDVVKYDAEAYIDGAHPTDNGVNLSGFINAYCILRVGDDLVRIEKCIPVEENIEFEDVCRDSCYIGRCYVTGVNLNVNNTPEDKDGNTYLSVVMNMTLECEAEHHRNREYELVADAFREGEENTSVFGAFDYNELIGAVSERKKISLVQDRDEENLHDIIEKCASVKNLKYEVGASEITVTCDLFLTFVCRGADTGECFSVKMEDAVCEKIKLPGATDACKIRISAVPCEVSPAFDSEKIYAETTLIITALAEDGKREPILTLLNSEKKCASGARRITVYYPEQKDTLWSVSKKYGISPERIAQYNMLSRDSNGECTLEGKRKIVIC